MKNIRIEDMEAHRVLKVKAAETGMSMGQIVAHLVIKEFATSICDQPERQDDPVAA